MTIAEAIGVFERNEIPHRYLDTGKLEEVFWAVRLAGQVLIREVRKRGGGPCKTCRHMIRKGTFSYCHLTATDDYTECSTLGGGCFAWEGKDADPRERA